MSLTSATPVIERTRPFEPIPVVDSAVLVPLPSGDTLLVGAPPEALKILILWEFPSPGIVVLPPDPLYAEGMNQASLEFLFFNHLFVRGGLKDRKPFIVVCDPEQEARINTLMGQIAYGPDDEQMRRFGTPASHRRQLLREMQFVSGEAAARGPHELFTVIALHDGRALLPDGTLLECPSRQSLRVSGDGNSVEVPRRAPKRAALPLYFADVDRAVVGPRFGLQVIGSASGFSASEWGSCFIIWINGLPLIVDGTPYLTDHLRRLGIEDDHILGYLITHTHEDHANFLGQLISRRPVTILTSPPVMAGLSQRLSAILDLPEKQIRRMFHWVRLDPGFESTGEPLPWFGAKIRSWYSVHTIPTLGVQVSMEGHRIRMPGDTLWGKQLKPLLDHGILSKKRHDFIQKTYASADVVIADAGGGPVHPDPLEVQELVSSANGTRVLVTHIPESARGTLPCADPGTNVTLIPRRENLPEDAMALFGSPLFRTVSEAWLLAVLHGSEVIELRKEPVPITDDGYFVLAGSLALRDGGSGDMPHQEWCTLEKGDFFQRSVAPQIKNPELFGTARWTRLLRVPATLYTNFAESAGLAGLLAKLYRTRRLWQPVTGEELGLETLTSLARLSRERSFEDREIVVRQGEEADHFYVVAEGRVEVYRETGSQTLRFGEFGPGFHFGELALMDQELRTATVRIVEPSIILELPARDFRRHLLDIPIARYRISQAAKARTAQLAPSLPEDDEEASNGTADRD